MGRRESETENGRNGEREKEKELASIRVPIDPDNKQYKEIRVWERE